MNEQARKHYECRVCRHRVFSHEYRATCPECGGGLRTIAVPRE